MNKEIVFDLISDLLGDDIEKVKKIGMDEDLSLYGMTSILYIKLVVMLEEEYGFVIEDSDLLIENLNSYSKIFDLLKKYCYKS